jgi:hypothetical protein
MKINWSKVHIQYVSCCIMFTYDTMLQTSVLIMEFFPSLYTCCLSIKFDALMHVRFGSRLASIKRLMRSTGFVCGQWLECRYQMKYSEELLAKSSFFCNQFHLWNQSIKSLHSMCVEVCIVCSLMTKRFELRLS